MAGEACVARGARVAGGHAWQERRPLQQAVRILLECILCDKCCLDYPIGQLSDFLFLPPSTIIPGCYLARVSRK